MSIGRWLLAAAALAGAAHAWALPDAVRGEQVYARCLACHALAVDRVGPRHCGLFGRLAGSVPGFTYSEAMKKSKIVWNDKTLDRFLAKPLAMVPGTAMTYDGVADPTERADLIAYLKRTDEAPPCSGRRARQ
ncbi:c-type cytochrome [Variovorax paradoxus]|jgi:cytochrome c|uniref:c-type cytochrome n=1 Tax=Variovorax paradoxus TaxID=34073 RepID=UPI0029C80BE2|nr:cytochrome c family protein [Variovorax paradoxus]WPH24432.1 cytochrome c family protein [Variovorax paradoxus]